MGEQVWNVDDRWEEMLAEDLSLSVEQFVEVFGAGWTPADVLTADGWFVTGEPPQLLLRSVVDGFELATPAGTWPAHEVVYHAASVHAFARWQLEGAVVPRVVRDLLRRRRSSFRWCRYCRRLTPPELRDEEHVCMSCGEAWGLIVH